MPQRAIHPEYEPVKTSFSHIGGKFGRILMEHFYVSGWIEKDGKEDDSFHITAKGKREFAKLGIDISELHDE